MAKFAVGEIALLAAGTFVGNVGDEVEIIAVGPFPPHAIASVGSERFRNNDVPADYVIHHPATGGWFACEHNLRKRPQRGTPDEVLRWFEAPITEDATA